MFVVVLIGVKPISRLILHYEMTPYLVTNADWNYSEEGWNMSGDKRDQSPWQIYHQINEIMGSHKKDGSKIIIRCPDRLNSNGYMDVFNKRPLPTYGRNDIFQQDNAPCHKFRVVSSFMDNCGICCLSDWSFQSPDLNIIETLWSDCWLFCWLIISRKGKQSTRNIIVAF